MELELRPIRFIAELKTLDWSELTPEERVRLLNVRNIPDVVMQALHDRRKELRNAVINLEAEMDQISDFVEGFWRNTEGGMDDARMDFRQGEDAARNEGQNTGERMEQRN